LGTILPAVLASLVGGCARVSVVDEADAGPSQPTVLAVEPRPGPVQGSGPFTVQFSAAMDEGRLLAASGRSETVVLALEAEVERAAAAIEHAQLSAHERTLLVPAQADVASDRRSLTLLPDRALPVGVFYLLVSSRLRDSSGRRLAGNGARFAYQVVPPPPRARLVSPAAGAEAPANLPVVRAWAESGRVALVGPDGSELAFARAQGEVKLALSAPLSAGALYRLALDGAPDAEQSFTAAPCARTAPPALQGGGALVSVRDTGATVQVVLDWPARVEVQVAEAQRTAVDDPCLSSGCVAAEADISCSPPPCGPQVFACAASLRVDGLKPATDYTLRVVAQDDLGFSLRGPQQRFTTVAPLPRVLVSEVMAAPASPQGEAEYVEILNLGPGVAALDSFALLAADGIVRPLLATPPPLPVQLAPGGRALAVGAAFVASRYPSLPEGTPCLRASTQRLLGRGLADGAPAAFRLVLQGAISVELASFPGGGPPCPAGASLQRDEAVPPGAQAPWSCGSVGGTPGKAP
jgi:hypothetical protein